MANSFQLAVTNDGKRVILKEDGTWEYENKEEFDEAKSNNPNFRNSKWGMTKEQVKSTEMVEFLDLEEPFYLQNPEKMTKEQAKSTETKRFFDIKSKMELARHQIRLEDALKKLSHGKNPENILLCIGNLGGLKCLISYEFYKKILFCGNYIFVLIHEDENDYINDYIKMKERLVKKYGKPISDQTIWKDDLYKDHRLEWGMALNEDDVEFISKWQTEMTGITLLLSGSDYDINLTLNYKDTTVSDLVDKEKEKELVDKERENENKILDGL